MTLLCKTCGAHFLTEQWAAKHAVGQDLIRYDKDGNPLPPEKHNVVRVEVVP